MRKISFSLRIYFFLSFIIDPIYLIHQYISVLRGKESTARFWERWVNKKINRPLGSLIWLHAASVGETLSLIPLTRKLLSHDPKINILITSTTKTSAEIFENISEQRLIHQMSPYDTVFASKRFLNHWKPDLAARVESEIWPRILLELSKNKTPNLLLNARFSKRSLRKIEQQKKISSFLFSLFDHIHVQENLTKNILVRLGIDDSKITTTGSLKDSRDKLPVDHDILRQFQSVISNQKIWLAACTHPGEDEVVLLSHKEIGGILIVAPRHVERGKYIAKLSRSLGFKTQLRSEVPGLIPETEVYIADTMGEMGLWYSLAKVAFIGGSLVDKGGHNPVEAAQLETFILHGPNVFNAKEKYERLTDNGFCFQVSHKKDIVKQILYLQEPDKRFDPTIGLFNSDDTALDKAFCAIKSNFPKN